MGLIKDNWKKCPKCNGNKIQKGQCIHNCLNYDFGTKKCMFPKIFNFKTLQWME